MHLETGGSSTNKAHQRVNEYQEAVQQMVIMSTGEGRRQSPTDVTDLIAKGRVTKDTHSLVRPTMEVLTYRVIFNQVMGTV